MCYKFSYLIDFFKLSGGLSLMFIYSIGAAEQSSIKEIIEQEIYEQQAIPLLDDSLLDINNNHAMHHDESVLSKNDSVELSPEKELGHDVLEDSLESLFFGIENQKKTEIDGLDLKDEDVIEDTIESFDQIMEKPLDDIQDLENSSHRVDDICFEESNIQESKQEIKIIAHNEKLASFLTPLPEANEPLQNINDEGNKNQGVKARAIIKKETVERVVIISNEITDDMLTYKRHWTGNYTPSKFVVMVNDQEIKKGVPTPIKVQNGILQVTFNFEFTVLGRVQRSGGKKLEYKISSDVKKIHSTFSWDEPTNIVINDAALISSSDIV